MTSASIKPDTEHIIPTLHPAFAERRCFRADSVCGELWDILDQVCDPELPGLTLWDLGVLQDVQLSNDASNNQQITVVLTPTYSGCPAVDAMSEDAIKALNNAGFNQVKVTVTLAPAWSTDMISPNGKKQLQALSIAPPNEHDHVDCPVCGSGETEVLSQFGSTACKAMYRCQSCSEVFDYFKNL